MTRPFKLAQQSGDWPPNIEKGVWIIVSARESERRIHVKNEMVDASEK